MAELSLPVTSWETKLVCCRMDRVRNRIRKLAGFVARVYGHIFIRPLQRYNVENRAFKLLDRMETSAKPIVTAPKYKPTKEYLKQLIKEHPELMQKVNETPPDQLENLKQLRLKVEVVPYAENVKIESDESREEARKLPAERVAPRLFEMGVKDPDKVPVGKISLREAIDMVRGHRLDPDTFNAKYLAEFHDMKEEDVFNILDHFKTYNVYNNDDLAANRRAPWYSQDNIEDFLIGDSGIVQWQKGEREHERREAWRKYLEEKKKEPKVDPKLIEIAGLEAIEAHREAQKQKQPESLPEEPKRIP